MNGSPHFFRSYNEFPGKGRADRITELDMTHQAFPKKSGSPVACQIDELIWVNHVCGNEFLLVSAYLSHLNEVGLPKFFQTPDVGSEVNFGRNQHMPDPMPWKKRHRDPVDFSCDKRRGGVAERRLKVNFFCCFQFFQVIKTAAADDSNSHGVLWME